MSDSASRNRPILVLVLEKGGSGVLQKLRTERWVRIAAQTYVHTPFRGRGRGRLRNA